MLGPMTSHNHIKIQKNGSPFLYISVRKEKSLPEGTFQSSHACKYHMPILKLIVSGMGGNINMVALG